MNYSDEDLQRRLKEQSMSGDSGKRSPDRKIRMKYKDYKKTIAAIAIASAIATTTVIGGGQAVIHQTKDSISIGSMCMDFQRDCISKETHRTDDMQHYFYDYADIASYIEGMDDFDLGVFLSYETIGEHQTDQVMRYTNYRSFENYLEAHDYEDSKEFSKDMRERATILADIQQKEEELAQMKAEHPDTSENSSEDQIGGVK